MTSLKIITDRSDNGNVFLCLSCVHAAMRSGTMTQSEVHCGASEFSFGGYSAGPVPFPVTKCSEYRAKEINPPGEMLRVMRQKAWYFYASREGKGVVLIPPDEFERREKG